MSEDDNRLDAMEQAEKDNPLREITLEELTDILETTIKFDVENKVITFLSMLGTYTDEEQTNILFKAESTTGKSYIPLETVQYFPEGDVEKISYASPMSFFHKYGKRVEESNETVTEDGKEVKRKHVYYLIDMSKRIYIFKDMPSDKLLEVLRSLLSHDERQMQIQYTNKTEKAGYRTQHIIIKGYPTVIFCTALTRVFDLQESTRFFVLSPEVNSKKIEEAIRLLAIKRGNKKLFTQKLDSDAKRHWLCQRIKNIKDEQIDDVLIPNSEKVAEDFIKSKQHLQPRHMRDFPRLLSLIKYWALLNCWTRDRDTTADKKIIYAKETDIEVGFILYKAICEANELGISPETFRVYKEVFENYDIGTGLTKENIASAYYKVYSRPLGNRRLDKDILPNLLAVGLIYEVEGTGSGGKPRLYRLSKFMENEVDKDIGKQLPLGQNKKPESIQERLNCILQVLALKVPLTTDEILTQTDGVIPSQDVPKLLNQLLNDGKIYRPNDMTYCKV